MSNARLEKKDNRYKLHEYSDFVIADEKLWYSSNFFNGLFCQDLTDGHVDLVGFFPDEEFNQKDLYWKVFLIERKIVFIPFNAKSICIYDMENKDFEKVAIPNQEIKRKYISAILVENKVYLFPAFALKALCLDISRKTVGELKEFNVVLDSLNIKNKQIFYGIGTEILEDWIYLIIKDTNQVIGYHWKSKKVILRKFGLDTIKLASIAICERQIYISVMGENKLICWNPSVNEENVICYQADVGLDKKIPVIMICDTNLFFYFLYENILYEALIKQISLKDPVILGEANSFIGIKQVFDDLFFIPTYGNSICRYDIKRKQLRYVPKSYLIPSNIWLERLCEAGKCIIYENEIVSLNNYCDVVHKIQESMLKKLMTLNEGKKIWEYLKTNDM